MTMQGAGRRGVDPATFTYVEGTTGNRPSWKFALPYWPIFAAIPKQHDAMALAMIRLVIEAVEQNKSPPVPLNENASSWPGEITCFSIVWPQVSGVAEHGRFGRWNATV